MKKSIKRLLVLTQVLGWSALVAAACSKNASETKPIEPSDTKAPETKNNNPQDNKQEEKTAVELPKPTKLDDAQQKSVRDLLTKDLFKPDNFDKIVNGTFTSDKNELKGILDKFPVFISNDQGENIMASHDNSEFVAKYGEQLEKGGVTEDKKVAPSTTIDPNKKSIDGVNGPLDPEQAKPPKKPSSEVKK